MTKINHGMSGPSRYCCPADDSSLVGGAVPSWRILRFVKKLLPQPVIIGLIELKKRALACTFSRYTEFKQLPEDAQASAAMSIIVPIHDAPKVTCRCLASLEKFAPAAEIILVDDASSLTESLEVIQHFSSRNGWRVIRHDKAHGHSGACRFGTGYATRPYLCLLNSDTVVTPWCWRQLKEAFEHDPKIGIAGPSTSNTGNPQSQQLAEFLSTYWDDKQICAFADRLRQESAVTDIEWVSGNALFIRRELWEEMGGFDPNLTDYGNEIELCGRVAAKGHRLVWVHNAYIHHFGRQSYRDTLGDAIIRDRIHAAEIYTSQKKNSPAR